MSPKLLKKLGLIIGIFVGIIIILFLFASCSKGGSSSKIKTIRTDMVQYAYKYYQKKENQDDLPQDDGSTTSLSLKKIIEAGYMSDPKEAYNDESIKCSGEVVIENNNGHYLYTPIIECKSDKKDNNVDSVLLRDKIIEDQLVETSVGLYAMGNTYVERGEVENNYVKIDEDLFRIVRINEDGTIRLITTKAVNNVRWDDRYNIDQKNNNGINDFINEDINSRINERLIEVYNEKTDKLKAYVTTQSLCVGKRSAADTSKDGSTECAKTVRTQFGAIAVYEYLQASLDKACELPESSSCLNYNWLSDKAIHGWSVTADAETNFKAFQVNGTSDLKLCSTTKNVYPVFNISSNVLYKSGTGTKEDPYIIKYFPVGEEYEKAKKEDKNNKNSD